MLQAIVAAAGQGERLRGAIEKPYVQLGQWPILVHTLRALERVSEIDSIVLVVHGERKNWVEEEFLKRYSIRRVASVAAGGARRMDSVYVGLSSVESKTKWVLVHDAARPLVRSGEVSRLIREAKRVGAVCPGVIPKDTTKRINGNSWIKETLDREQLRAILTPQIFRKEILVRAYEKAYREGYRGTDDASLVERLGVRVKVIEGDRENIKITTPEDLLLAEAILKKRRKLSLRGPRTK